MLRHRLAISMALLAMGGTAFALTFTGDVLTDFAGENFAAVQDHQFDVGWPANADNVVSPNGSGWDIDCAKFVLDMDNDMLYIGVDFFNIAGDADGDGAQGGASAWLQGNGGFDTPDLSQTESICVALDFDADMAYDVIAGVSSWDATYQVASFNNGSSMGQSFAFGAPLPNAGPHAYLPDFEMAISGISQLGNVVTENGISTLCFDFSVFAGSIQDDGIGEDLLIDTICITDDRVVEAVIPAGINLMQAFPNPFNPSTTLNVELAETGSVELGVYNLQGQLVSTLVDGMMASGTHALHFDGSALPSGMYLARLATENGIQVERLLLTK